MKKFIIMLLAVMVMMGAAPAQAESKKSEVKTEQVSKSQDSDKNPVVGIDKKGRTIHQGAKGGLYYWTTTKKGENAGKARKQYLTKAEKEEFYKSHPQAKKGGAQ